MIIDEEVMADVPVSVPTTQPVAEVDDKEEYDAFFSVT